MKISLEWLSEYLPGPLDPAKAAEILTAGGLPVELIERHGADTVLDVEVTSNRGDCLSHVGIARELSALMKREMREVKPAVPDNPVHANTVTSVRIDAPHLCPHYIARVIRGVKVGPSPEWLVRRLAATLRTDDGKPYRSINNVVDATNYVMLEMGQPLHAFDFSKLRGRKIVVRNAAPGEKLTSIDAKQRVLTPDMLVIADEQGPVALAGVMGGRETEITAGTTDVLLESARFDPLGIRKTTRALRMKSDSSYRFERGIDPTLPARASLRAAELILQLAGGQLLGGMVAAGQSGYRPKALSLRLSRLKGLLGVEFPTPAVVDALARLQLAPVVRGDVIEVAVPSWRLDLNLEVDLIEEVARVIGYEQIPVRDQIQIRVTPPQPDAQATSALRDTLIGAGYFESVTFSFVSDALAPDFLPPEAAPGAPGALPLPRADGAVREANAHLRPSLLPGLLESVARNQNAGIDEPRLFEIGAVFWNAPGGRVEERQRLALVGSGDVREVRGAVEAVLARLDSHRAVAVLPDTRPGYARGACGRVEWGGKPIGYLGRINRDSAAKLSLREVPAAAELEMAALLAGAQLVPQLQPLPKYPAVRRDLSLIVPESTRYDALDTLVRELKPQWLEGLDYVTTYRGKPLEAGTKSVTIQLVFRSPDGTLTSEQVETSVQRVVDTAKAKLNATLRT